MQSDYEAITKHNEEQLGKDTASRKSQVNMYSDFSHFVYEILQNADDYDATTVTFKLNENELVIDHNGIPFEEENVKAISYFGKSTSRDDLIKTGWFGLGFKSVFAFTASPSIHSGEENFEIYNLYRLKALLAPYDLEPEKTRIRLPFNHMEKRPDYVETLVAKGKAFDKISYRLKNLDLTTLLFTRNILEIKWNVQDKEGNYDEGHYLREDRFKKNFNAHFQTRKTEITDGNILHTYLIFSRPIKWQGGDHKPVDVAFYLDDHDATEVIRLSKKPLFVLFSTTVQTHMGFLMNGPFRTPAHRETVSQDDEFNQFLIEEIASLLGQSLLDIRERGLLTVSFFETLPIRMKDFPSNGMFQPIVDSVRHALMERELLPSDDGMFASAKNIKLARGAELRKLLPPAQLKQLFSSHQDIKWLSGEITQARTPDLRSYLMNELDVEEITRDVFARKLSGAFLKSQSDEWIISFYTYLSGREALWKKAKYNWDSTGPLRYKLIIRLNNGNHVNPFRTDGSPNAYLPVEKETDLPIVNVKIAKNEIARDFLKKLGIPEQDLVAEVFEKILPKYNQSYVQIFLEEHKRDIEKIQRSYLTDSHEKKRRLSKKLKDTPFIYAECSALYAEAYKRPAEVYFSNHNLLMYFEGNKDAWFVSLKYNEILLSLIKDRFMDFLKELGVAENIRIKRKKENHQGYVVIVSSHGGHKRGHNGFDPDIEIDGLECAIKHPTMEKSLFIWNNLAIPHSDCISGIIESSSRKTYEFSRKNKGTSEFGHLLINSAWLPDHDEYFHMPGELSLDDLPESFRPDEKLSKQLGMKKDVMAKLATEAGIFQTTISLAQKLEKQPELLKEFESRLHAFSSHPEFPKSSSNDPVRREEHLIDDLQTATEKTYEVKERSVRTTRGSIDPVVWLRSLYTNDSDQMVCQICKEEMPFRKLDGEYYFVKVEALDRNILTKEHEAQFLALCPLCAAMYKELIKRDENAMARLKDDLMTADDLEFPIKLGDREASLRFVETHFNDLKVILRESGEHGD